MPTSSSSSSSCAVRTTGGGAPTRSPADMELAVGASEATIKSLLSKLGGLLAEEYAVIRGIRGDTQFINDELTSMQAFLSNLARAGSPDGHDDQTRDWMKQVRDVSYDIEDCVDDFAHSLCPDPRGTDWVAAVRRALYEIRTWSTRRAIAAQIVDLKARAQHVGERRVRYGVRDPGPGTKNGLGGVTEYHAAEHQQITRYLVRVQEPVGVKDDDMKKLHDWVIPDKNKKLGVLSIVGFGGVGKTTVALALYRKCGDQFQRRAMVTVSQNSDPQMVLRNILGQVKPQADNGEQQGEDSTGTVSEPKSNAAVVRSVLSRISWRTGDQEKDGSARDAVDKVIKEELEKYLKTNRPLTSWDEWIKVCDSLFPESQICHKPEDFMRIVNHCYNGLASDLKTCSLYLSIFPKGRKISRKPLIRRWIAEGFVSEKQGLSVEDVAETCFNQLIARKMIRPVEHCSNGRVKGYQVHDMVLEYIISKAAEEDFITVVGSYWSVPSRSNKVRRLSLHSNDSKRAKKVDSMNLSHVRSLTVFGSLDNLRIKSFKTGIVQVLDLQGCKGFRGNHVKVLDICKMILLKYLNLRRTDIKSLPPDIGKLKYLETLDIRETEVQELPKTVGQLERISNLLGGNKKTRKGLKLPREIKKGTMNTLRVLSGIEIVDGSTAACLHQTSTSSLG